MQIKNAQQWATVRASCGSIMVQLYCTHAQSALAGRLFFSLDHDDVITKFRLDGRVCVDGFVHGAGGQGKGSLLERAHHRASGHPAQVTLS